MSDKVKHVPLHHGPTTYDFGNATPAEWPQGPYVPLEVYNELLDRKISVFEERDDMQQFSPGPGGHDDDDPCLAANPEAAK